jgi:intracellular septation protein A
VHLPYKQSNQKVHAQMVCYCRTFFLCFSYIPYCVCMHMTQKFWIRNVYLFGCISLTLYHHLHVLCILRAQG